MVPRLWLRMQSYGKMSTQEQNRRVRKKIAFLDYLEVDTIHPNCEINSLGSDRLTAIKPINQFWFSPQIDTR
jgi:hypothetical protein